MKTLLTKIAILTGCLSMSACVFSEQADRAAALTKADAQLITNPGEDLCDVYNWYGDGECDTFCENADPDCDIQCDALPVCADGFKEVEACHSESECRQVSLCGTTIQCQQETYCLEAAAPYLGCEEGYELVETCVPNGAECYEIGGFCGVPSMFCQAQLDCQAIPVCPEEYIEVDSCPTDSNCYEETICGVTVACMEGVVNCLAYPTCPVDSKEVTECDPSATCTEATMCGVTILCQSSR